jgi:hypothetical protein
VPSATISRIAATGLLLEQSAHAIGYIFEFPMAQQLSEAFRESHRSLLFVIGDGRYVR